MISLATKAPWILGKDWRKGGPSSSVFFKLSDQCKSSRGMASWLAEPFFLLSLSVAAAAPVKNHFLLLNPKRAIPVGKISSKYFLYFLSFARKKKSFLLFLPFQVFVIVLPFLVPSGFLWLSYFVFKVPYGSPFRAPGRITPFFTRCTQFFLFLSYLGALLFIYLSKIDNKRQKIFIKRPG